MLIFIYIKHIVRAKCCFTSIYTNCELGTINISTLQMGNRRHRESKQFACHSSTK